MALINPPHATHTRPSPQKKRLSGQSESVMHSERLDVVVDVGGVVVVVVVVVVAVVVIAVVVVVAVEV